MLGLAGGAARAGRTAGLFDDDEARKAILDLRQKLEQSNEAQRARQAELNAQMADQLSQLKRSLLDLNNQLEQMRADMAKLRGQDEQLARDVAELQRKQKDVQHGIDERIRKLEPQKVSLDGKEFLADPEEKRQYDEALAPSSARATSAAAAGAVDLPAPLPAERLHSIGALLARQRAVRAARVQGGDRARSARCWPRAPDHPKAPEAMLVDRQLPGRAEGRQGRAQDHRRAGEGLPEVGGRAGRPRATGLAQVGARAPAATGSAAGAA